MEDTISSLSSNTPAHTALHSNLPITLTANKETRKNLWTCVSEVPLQTSWYTLAKLNSTRHVDSARDEAGTPESKLTFQNMCTRSGEWNLISQEVL